MKKRDGSVRLWMALTALLIVGVVGLANGAPTEFGTWIDSLTTSTSATPVFYVREGATTSKKMAGATANTASTVVLRDASGNFSAGTITAALTGNASTATALAADPADCAANNFATAINASGTLTCAQPSISAGVSGLGTSVATALGVNVGTSGAVLVKGTSVCADLSNGATGCSTATGTSGATIPLLNGTNTWSGAQSFNAAIFADSPAFTTQITTPAVKSGAGVIEAISTTAAAQTASTTAGVGLTITADPAVAGSTNAGAAAGGNITLTAGAAAQKTSGNAAGGNIVLATGAGVGTGAAGVVVLPSTGSATAPALTFSGDTDNGIYYTSTNAWVLAAGSAAQQTISAAGTAFNNTADFSGNGVRGNNYVVSPRTSDFTLSGTTHAGLMWTNTGASADIIFTLPTATAGYSFNFAVTAAHYIKVKAAGTDTINNAGSVSAAAGFIRSTTVGHTVKVVCTVAGTWMVINHEGTWTVDS